jgi:MarR family 2-MHQ and catechol resistance regulon transcriptional repressor
MPTHYSGTPKEVLALNTFIKLTRSVEAINARLMAKHTIGGLTISQFGVLETLYHLGPMCQGEISAKLLKSTGNITLVIDNLEKQGLIRRVRDQEDRRMVMIYLTPKGEELIKEIFPRHMVSIVDEMNQLTEDEQEILGRLCRKLGKRLGKPE